MSQNKPYPVLLVLEGIPYVLQVPFIVVPQFCSV